MAGALRRLTAAAARSLRSPSALDATPPAPLGGIPALPGQQLSRRLGDMPRKEDPFIEAWGARRETVEYDFVWDWPTVRSLALWVVAVPVVVYKGIVSEFNHTDDLYGRKRRDFL